MLHHHSCTTHHACLKLPRGQSTRLQYNHVPHGAPTHPTTSVHSTYVTAGRHNTPIRSNEKTRKRTARMATLPRITCHKHHRPWSPPRQDHTMHPVCERWLEATFPPDSHCPVLDTACATTRGLFRQARVASLSKAMTSSDARAILHGSPGPTLCSYCRIGTGGGGGLHNQSPISTTSSRPGKPSSVKICAPRITNSSNDRRAHYPRNNGVTRHSNAEQREDPQTDNTRGDEANNATGTMGLGHGPGKSQPCI